MKKTTFSIQKTGILIILLLSGYYTKAQTNVTITVNGDADKFYPVVFSDPSWGNNEATVLRIGRANVHTNGSWVGSAIATFTYHTTQGGHGANFINADISSKTLDFFGGWEDATALNDNSNVIIWMRGGGLSYNVRCQLTVAIDVYDGVQHTLPYMEPAGPSRSFKTAVDRYVRSNGLSLGKDLLVTANQFTFGKVGIGTTAPIESLDIRGGGINVGAKGEDRYMNVFGTWRTQGTNSAGLWDEKMEGENLAFHYYTGSGWNTYRLSLTPGGFASTGTMNIMGGGDNLIAGNVRIGTSVASPEKLSVNGKIRAQEIKVEAANWPDYVFNDNYKPSSLAELESYIKLNRHLPEMPSAKEVTENGVELGEMNKLLLKKIEELTLHLIDKEKELIQTIKKVEVLESKERSTSLLLQEIQKVLKNKIRERIR